MLGTKKDTADGGGISLAVWDAATADSGGISLPVCNAAAVYHHVQMVCKEVGTACQSGW